MPTYRVNLKGQNFWLRMSGGLQHLGFYTNRFVEAPDPSTAEIVALNALRADPKLRSAENSPADPPTILIEDVRAVPVSAVPAAVPGYVFFTEKNNGDS